jgi:hypothetical protein
MVTWFSSVKLRFLLLYLRVKKGSDLFCLLEDQYYLKNGEENVHHEESDDEGKHIHPVGKNIYQDGRKIYDELDEGGEHVIGYETPGIEPGDVEQHHVYQGGDDIKQYKDVRVNRADGVSW